MENIGYRTHEEKEACNLIKQRRRYNRIVLRNKTIHNSFDLEEGKTLATKLKISVNRRTGKISICNGLSWGRGFEAYPTTHQKLRCINQHAIDALRNRKKAFDNKRRRSISFSTNIHPYISVYESIYYYEDNGYVFATSSFHISYGKLKVIDELRL